MKVVLPSRDLGPSTSKLGSDRVLTMSRDDQEDQAPASSDNTEESQEVEVIQTVAVAKASIRIPSKLPEYSDENAFITEDALALVADEMTKWSDVKQQGPSPADFGDHKPIPIDSVCASVVVSADAEYEGQFDPETEAALDELVELGQLIGDYDKE